MYYKREITSKIKKMVKTFPALIITGARQTGKTTLIKNIFPNHNYVSLDLPSNADMAEHDPDSFFSNYPPPLIIDEAHYAPNLFRQLKVLIDKDKTKKGQFIVSGSQNFLLMENVVESLAGRIAVCELDTFSSKEILENNKNVIDTDSKNNIIKLLLRGTFPELWENIKINSNDFYHSYLSTYIQRDIRSIVKVASLSDFEKFLRICATQSGQLINKSVISKKMGLSLPTINSWLSILQTSKQISILEPYFKNLGKRIIKTPKLYFHDTGLMCFLLGITKETFKSQNSSIGQVWETFVFNQIKRAILFNSTSSTMWFWQNKDHDEVDFLIGKNNKINIIEAKFSENISDKTLFKLNKIKNILKAEEIIIAKPTGKTFKSKKNIILLNAVSNKNWI
jgi:uncharacterized protein